MKRSVGARVAHGFHLVGRFARALRPLPPSRSDVAWAQSLLTPEERALWSSQPRADRRESIGVARRAARALEGTPRAGEPVWPAAALLHDAGKRDARLGVVLRSLATVAGAIRGPGVVGAWAQRRGLRRRLAAYLDHARIGADMIRLAGGREEVAVWAGAHHSPERWGSLGAVPPDVARVLAAADGERA